MRRGMVKVLACLALVLPVGMIARAGIHIDVGLGGLIPGLIPPPVYYSPPPVYATPPPPVYYGPGVIYGNGDWNYGGYGWRDHDWDGDRWHRDRWHGGRDWGDHRGGWRR